MTHVLTIPAWHPTPINTWEGCHWSVRSKLKRLDREMVSAYAWRTQIPRAKGKRRITLTIILGKRQRGCDPDAYWKLLLDAMKYAGLIVDDSPKWVELAPVQYERGERGTRVEIVEVNNG